MPTIFKAQIKFKGLDGRITSRNIDLGEFDTGTDGGDYEAAQSALSQIETSYDNASLATIIESSLRALQTENAAAGAGDISECALINLYLDAAGEKTAQITVPAPTSSVFLAASGPTMNVVNTGHALVTDLALQYSQHAFISDGESVDVTVNNGVDSGRRITKPIPKP